MSPLGSNYRRRSTSKKKRDQVETLGRTKLSGTETSGTTKSSETPGTTPRVMQDEETPGRTPGATSSARALEGRTSYLLVASANLGSTTPSLQGNCVQILHYETLSFYKSEIHVKKAKIEKTFLDLQTAI